MAKREVHIHLHLHFHDDCEEAEDCEEPEDELVVSELPDVPPVSSYVEPTEYVGEMQTEPVAWMRPIGGRYAS